MSVTESVGGHRPITQQGLSGVPQSRGLVSREFRPMTGMSGMSGMTTSTGMMGPGHSTSHYASLLKRKCSEVEGEIENLQKKSEILDEKQRERLRDKEKCKSLTDEVTELEKELSDYNLAYDKFREGVSVEDLQKYLSELEDRNLDEKETVDRLFVLRKEAENETQKLMNDIESIKSEIEDRVKLLSDRDQEKYKQYQERQEKAKNDLINLKKKLFHLKAKAENMEKQAPKDTYGEEYEDLLKKLETRENKEKLLQKEIRLAGSR